MAYGTEEENIPAIVHAVTPGRVGGLESVVQLLAGGQRQTGRRVAVVSVVERDEPGHPFHANLRQAGVELVVLALPGRSYRREIRELARAFRMLKARVVHTHGYRSDVLAGRAARSLQLPTVSTAHGFTGGGWKNRMYEYLQIRSWRRFSAVVAVSTPLGERIRATGVPADRLHLIPNAWAPGEDALARPDARLRLGLRPQAAILGWVGRLSREKGADLLLEALADIPGAEAALLGDGRERTALEQRIRELGIADRVHLLGEIPGAHRLYPAFDIFVLSSRTEGMPICLFEAMAAGVPVVATRVGGVPDVVSGEDALLVEPEAPAALAAAIRSALNDPAAAGARAVSARERLRRDFAPAPWVERYLALYDAVSPLRSERAPT